MLNSKRSLINSISKPPTTNKRKEITLRLKTIAIPIGMLKTDMYEKNQKNPTCLKKILMTRANTIKTPIVLNMSL